MMTSPFLPAALSGAAHRVSVLALLPRKLFLAY